MKNNKAILYIGLGFLALAIIVTYMAFRGPETSETINTSPANIHFEEENDHPQEVDEEDRQKLTEVTRETEPENVVLVPKNSKYKEQAEKDPHRTPQILIDFARKLSPQIQEALKKEEKADEFFPLLAKCVEEEDGVAAAKAFCLSAADRLSVRYPKFRKSFLDMKSAAGSDARKIFESSESID